MPLMGSSLMSLIHIFIVPNALVELVLVVSVEFVVELGLAEGVGVTVAVALWGWRWSWCSCWSDRWRNRHLNRGTAI